MSRNQETTQGSSNRPRLGLLLQFPNKRGQFSALGKCPCCENSGRVSVIEKKVNYLYVFRCFCFYGEQFPFLKLYSQENNEFIDARAAR